MNTTVTLTAQQIAMVLGCFYEAKANGLVDQFDFDLFRETESIFENAEDFLYDVENRTSLGI